MLRGATIIQQTDNPAQELWFNVIMQGVLDLVAPKAHNNPGTEDLFRADARSLFFGKYDKRLDCIAPLAGLNADWVRRIMRTLSDEDLLKIIHARGGRPRDEEGVA